MPRMTEREALNIRIEYMYNHLFHQLKEKNKGTFARIPYNGNTEYFHEARIALLEDFDEFDSGHRRETMHSLRTVAALDDVRDVHQLMESTLAYWGIMPAMTPVNLLMEGRLASGHLVENVTKDMKLPKGTEDNFWLLTDDGYLEFHGGGFLRNEKGYVYSEYQGTEIIGSEGVETGLWKIFNYALSGNGNGNGGAETCSRDRIIDRMVESGLNYYVNGDIINERENWYWDLKENREQNGTRRIKLPREVRKFYRREFEPHWRQVEGGFIGANYTNEAGDAKYHVGVDWVWVCNNRNCTVGQPVYSATDGVVLDKGFEEDLGNFIRISCEDGARIDYFHLKNVLGPIHKKETVKKGQLIAYAGDTGVGGPHLHIAKSYLIDEKFDQRNLIEYRYDGSKLNEGEYLNLIDKNTGYSAKIRAYLIPPEPIDNER